MQYWCSYLEDKKINPKLESAFQTKDVIRCLVSHALIYRYEILSLTVINKSHSVKIYNVLCSTRRQLLLPVLNVLLALGFFVSLSLSHTHTFSISSTTMLLSCCVFFLLCCALLHNQCPFPVAVICASLRLIKKKTNNLFPIYNLAH